MRRAAAVLLLAGLAAIVWAGNDRIRFDTKQWELQLGAGPVGDSFYVNVTRDRFNGATIYTLTRDVDGTVSVIGFTAVAAPLPIVGPVPGPEPTVPPTPEPTSCPPPPDPPPCSKSYGASLEVQTVLTPSTLTAIFSGNWVQPPATGWLSDNAIPLNQWLMLPGVPITWVYERTAETGCQFGYLSLLRPDGTRCDVAAPFEIPAM